MPQMPPAPLRPALRRAPVRHLADSPDLHKRRLSELEVELNSVHERTAQTEDTLSGAERSNYEELKKVVDTGVIPSKTTLDQRFRR
eukprot:8614065-Alexandrium_andersonii.AAC.1